MFHKLQINLQTLQGSCMLTVFTNEKHRDEQKHFVFANHIVHSAHLVKNAHV